MLLRPSLHSPPCCRAAVISRGGLSHHGTFLLFKQSLLLFWKTLLLECRVCSSKSFVLFWKLLLRVESLQPISSVFCSGDGWDGWNTWWVAGRFGNCNRESHTSDTVSLLGSASAHRRPCVDGFILHVRKLSAHCCSLQCLFSMSLCTRAHPENCLLACVPRLSEHVQVKKNKKNKKQQQQQKGEKEGWWCLLFYLLLLLRSLPQLLQLMLGAS